MRYPTAAALLKELTCIGAKNERKLVHQNDSNLILKSPPTRLEKRELARRRIIKWPS